MIAKPLVNGLNAFYFNIPTRRRKNGCAVPNEALGQNYIILRGEDGTGGGSAALNQMFDEWERAQNSPRALERLTGCSTITSRAKPTWKGIRAIACELRAMRAFCDLPDKEGRRTGAS